MRILNDDAVDALGWDRVFEVLRDAFRDPGRFATAERVQLPAPGDGAWLTMPCADRDGWFGVKQVSVLPGNPALGRPSVQAWYTLMGPDGAPALAMGATRLTRIRTAAVSALAADHLAAPGASSLLVVGAGGMAPWLARAHLRVRPYASVRVWSRDAARAETVVTELLHDLAGAAARPAIDVAGDLEAAVREADVVSVATTARTPIVLGAWLHTRQHLDLVGAFRHGMAEADAEAVRRSLVVVDDDAAARAEAGDLEAAAAEGWSWDDVAGDLAALVAGRVRRDPNRPTLFKSVGLALEDLVVARALAEASGVVPVVASVP